MTADLFDRWFEGLEARHLTALNFQEVRRAVQALSSLYVERRTRMDLRTPFDGAGKRAAFSWYFAPLHFLLVRETVRALGAADPPPSSILDLGCGTGIAGAAWASELPVGPRITGVDRNNWVVKEARSTYTAFGLTATVQVADVSTFVFPPGAAVIAAFCVNEVSGEARDRLQAQMLAAHERGVAVLVVEPIAKRLAVWWDEWATIWRACGGREDQWRFRVPLPERLALMDKAAGLDHRELTGRSLWFPARRGNSP
jgi:hypothetical protein